MGLNEGLPSFQPGEGPSRGLLRDCTTSPINLFAALGDCLDPGPRHPRREEGGAGGGGGQEQLQGDLHPLRLGPQQQGVELPNSILYD